MTDEPVSFEVVPASRSYRHLKCQGETTVSETEFKVMANPLLRRRKTFCAQCLNYGPVKDFEWSDTGETIADYYDRHLRDASFADRVMGSGLFVVFVGIVGLVLSIALALVLGYYIHIWVGVLTIIPFAILGAVMPVYWAVFSVWPYSIRRAFGVSDARLLR